MAQSEWVSVSEAVRLSGLSTRTLKRLAVEERRIKFSRSPGGHIRIARADLDGLLRHSANAPAPTSSVLQNRKERVEELVLETQELRAKRELDRLQEEDADRERQRAEARRAEAVTRELALAQQRLQRKREAQRLERERIERAASRLQAEFERRWDRWARERLTVLKWLSFEQRETVLRIVEETVRARGPQDQDVMQSILTDAIARLCAPWEFDRQAQAKREELIERTVQQLPWGATDVEKVRAATDARAVLSQIPLSAKDWEIRAAVSAAVEPVQKSIEQRRASEEANARAMREAEEAEREKQRKAEERRFLKSWRVIEGVSRVDSYLGELYQDGEITLDAYSDSQWRSELKETVREELEAEMAESREGAERIAEEIVDEALE
jgi:excisionase family DNA binding protein